MEKLYDLSPKVETLGGKENMERDWHNLLKAHEGVCSFRLYRWKEPTISIGYSQEIIYKDLPNVKRPTGGGALLHHLDLSFSYAGLREAWVGSFANIYRNFMGLLLDSLRELEPSLEMSRYRGGYEDYFCYFYPTLGEITYRGRKLIACAMRLTKKAFLIHGSFFLDFDFEFFQRLTGIKAKRLKERIITFKELGLQEAQILKPLEYLKINLCQS